MTELIKCLRTQFKRGIKVYPFVLMFTLILVASLSITVASLFSQNDNDISKFKVKVAIVGDLSDPYLSLGLQAVKNFDSSKNYIEFITAERGTAVDMLEDNKISGILDIPDGFLDEITDGKDVKVKYISMGGPATLGPMLIEEVADIISQIVVSSQNGVYGFMDYASETKLSSEERSQIANQIAVEYAEHIFSRDNLYKTELADVYGKLTFKEYYICSFFIIFIMLVGITCTPFLVKDDMSLNAMLKSRGLGVLCQIAAEVFVFILIVWSIVLILFLSLGIVDSIANIGLNSLTGLNDIDSCFYSACKILPAIVLICAFQFMLFMLSDSIIGSVLLQISSAIALSFASGLLLPKSSLPQLLRSVWQYLPTSQSFNIVGDALFDVSADMSFLIGFVLTAVFIFVSYIAYSLRIRSSKL